MPLKIHMIETYDVDIKEGKTTCGEAFFKSLTKFSPPGEYESYRRIGGLRAVEVSDFDDLMFDNHICLKCRNKYWNR